MDKIGPSDNSSFFLPYEFIELSDLEIIANNVLLNGKAEVPPYLLNTHIFITLKSSKDEHKAQQIAEKLGIKKFNIDPVTLEDIEKSKLSTIESFSQTTEEVEESDTEQDTIPTKSSDPTYNWNIQPYEMEEHVVTNATPEELLHMSAKGAKITGDQFLSAAKKLEIDPRLKRDGTLATTLHKLYDKAAEKYMADGNIGKVFEIRSMAAQTVPILKRHPLYHIDEAISEGVEKQILPEFGAHFTGLDSGVLKGGNLRMDSRMIGNKDDFNEKNRVLFRINEFARRDLQKSLQNIEDNLEQFEKSLPPEMECEVSFEQTEYSFLRKDDDGFYPSDKAVKTSYNAIKINFEGIGTVTIGTEGALWQEVEVTIDGGLPEGEGIKQVQQMLTMLGLGPILGQQRPEDDERMRLAVLFRAFYPAAANQMERTPTFYELPLDDLKQAIILEEPEMAKIFDAYPTDGMYKESIYPGKEAWIVPDIGDRMRESGAMGLMTGFATSSTIKDAAQSLVRRLFLGSLSTLDRFNSGLIRNGLSSEEDMEEGGAEQVFTRLVTQENMTLPIDKFISSSCMQVVYSVDILNRGGYAYPEDCFGFKDPQREGYELAYGTRPNLMTFAKELKTTEWDDEYDVKIVANEVMIKNRADPFYMDFVVVKTDEDKKKTIEILKQQAFTLEGKQYPLVDDKGNVCLVTTITGKAQILKKPVDAFIKVATDGYFKVEMWTKTK